MIPIRRFESQRAQIIRHVAEFPDHLGIAEITRSGITRAAECDRPNMTLPCAIAPQPALQPRWD
jgi:hypothetical protein